MKSSSKQIDRKTLKSLEPLDKLNPILLDELAAKSIIEEVPAGRIICRHGESDSRQIYLLSGQIEVAAPGQNKVKVIKSKSPYKTPIAEGSPRTATLKTKTNSTLLYIDADLLELLMSDEPELGVAAYEVTELHTDDSDDWMLTFLQSPAFLQLPTDNIQKLLTHMEEVHVKKDQVIINQGDKDDNYYIIKSGTCNVHRKPFADAASVLLAVLPVGSGFGEEALITNGSRNATITMRENGTLMKLKKKDFLTLLINPLLTLLDNKQTQEKIISGSIVLDVRTMEEVSAKPMQGAVNIPLSMLRIKFDSLNIDREYLLVCGDGSQSAAAAFLMIQNGFKCKIIKGGMRSYQAATIATAEPANVDACSLAAKKQLESAKKQSEKMILQAQQIKDAREKTEADIRKHKMEIEASHNRIAKEREKVNKSRNNASKLKLKAEKELSKAQANSKENLQRELEAKEAMKKAEDILQQSTLIVKEARVKAEKEAAAIKQRAIDEAEYLRAEVEAARVKMEQDAARIKQEETIIKQSALKIKHEADEIRREAELNAQQVRAEVEQDVARIKQEEDIIKKSALKIKHEADEIRREALSDAQQVRVEIESTRALLNEKLQQAAEEEELKQTTLLAETKKHADKIAATKTQQAIEDAEAIRQQAKEDAIQLHKDLEETRKQIEAEAELVISQIKQQALIPVVEEIPELDVIDIVDEIDTEIVSIESLQPAAEVVDYKSVNIPGVSLNIPGLSETKNIDTETARHKAEAIKAKLALAQYKQAEQKAREKESGMTIAEVKIRKANDKTILESENDLFIFKEPENSRAAKVSNSQNYRAYREHTETDHGKSFVIHPVQEQESKRALKNNPFMHQDETQPPSTMNYLNRAKGNEPDFVISKNAQQFNKQAFQKRHNASKSNGIAIAASFVLILAGAVFTLHATDTLKVDTVASLFDSGNDNIQRTAIAKTKTIRKKVLRANTKVNVKKKVTNKMDDIMQGWKNVLNQAKNPKKLHKDNN